MKVTHPPTNIKDCPAEFEAEPYTKQSISSYEIPTVDANGQHPTMADQMSAQNVLLTREQWESMSQLPNPQWTPTHTRVYLDANGQAISDGDTEAIAAATVEYTVAVCPNCGTPVKVD